MHCSDSTLVSVYASASFARMALASTDSDSSHQQAYLSYDACSAFASPAIFALNSSIWAITFATCGTPTLCPCEAEASAHAARRRTSTRTDCIAVFLGGAGASTRLRY